MYIEVPVDGAMECFVISHRNFKEKHVHVLKIKEMGNRKTYLSVPLLDIVATFSRKSPLNRIVNIITILGR